jgi:hypothetical protein
MAESFENDPKSESPFASCRQIPTKLVLVIAGIVVGIGVMFTAVYLAYGDENEAAKTPSTAPAR